MLIVSDEERRNDWLSGKLELPHHKRLENDGISFNRYYTHSSPCSPSRASLYTGRYLADHKVVDNVSFPAHTALDPAIPTIGSILKAGGYHSSYLGKWHLSHSSEPNMKQHGYQDWQGPDSNYVGGPASGRHFDPIIASQATDWLKANSQSSQPWFLTVALVNPHDIMWYPMDHFSYQSANPKEAEVFKVIKDITQKEGHLNPPPEDYPQLFSELPENFDDDLHTKPDVQRAWRDARNTEHFVGQMDKADKQSWLRQLDYYAWLHSHLDDSLGNILNCLKDLGIYDSTTIAYTSDHGDACGSHGLRAKLPCVYEEVMGVPLIIKPANTYSSAPDTDNAKTYPFAGKTTDALATHIDLAATLVGIGGQNPSDIASLSGRDLTPVINDPNEKVRDWVFFSQDSAQSDIIANSRYAVRGFFDGQTKYARYYGIGGGIRRDGALQDSSKKRFDADADFDDHDHEWYDHKEDPLELDNLARDRSRRSELKQNFERLLEIEAAELSSIADGSDGSKNTDTPKSQT